MKKLYFLGLLLAGTLFFAGSVAAVSLVGPYGTLKVGESWSVFMVGFNSAEMVYATGGKVVGGVVPTDTNSYGPATKFNGVWSIILSGTFTTNDIGDWQITWKRASGEVIGTLNFTIVAASGTGSSSSGGGYIASSGSEVTDCSLWTAYNPFQRVYTLEDALKPVGVNAHSGAPYVAARWTGFDQNQSTAVQNINAYQTARNNGARGWVENIVNGLRGLGYNVSVNWTNPQSSSGYVTVPNAAIDIEGVIIENANVAASLNTFYDQWTTGFYDPIHVLLEGKGYPNSSSRVPGQPPCTNSVIGSATGAWWEPDNSPGPGTGTSPGTGTITIPETGFSAEEVAAYLRNAEQSLNRILQNYRTALNMSGTQTVSFSNMDAQYIQGLTSNLTQMYRNLLASSAGPSSVGAGTNTGTVPANATYPLTVRVTAHLLNVRSAPNTSAQILRQLPAGSTFTANNAVAGENVEGTDKWWLSSDGAYVWSGGTVTW